MSMFKGIGDAKSSINSDYIRAGRYLTYVKAFKSHRNRAEQRQAFFELIVVAVLDDSQAAAEPDGPHRVGDNVTRMWTLNKDAALPDLKLTLKTITGMAEDQITEAVCEQLASAANPLEGLFVEWSGRVGKTKQGHPFTYVDVKRRWSADEVEKAVDPALMASLKIDTKRA